MAAQLTTRSEGVDLGRFVHKFCSSLSPGEIVFFQENDIRDMLEEIGDIETQGLENNFVVWENKWRALSHKCETERFFFWRLITSYSTEVKRAQNRPNIEERVTVRYVTLMETIANQIFP